MSHRQYKIGVDRKQGMLLLPRIDEYVDENNPIMPCQIVGMKVA
jgi:hypothetical protein